MSPLEAITFERLMGSGMRHGFRSFTVAPESLDGFRYQCSIDRNNMLNQNPNAVELDPWLVVLGDASQGSLAMWRLADEKLPSDEQITVALFSTEQRANDYAEKCCDAPWRVIQVDRTRFLSLMVDCFRQGIRYATLNPGDSTAQSLFVLRDVLSAAKREFSKQ